MSDALRVQRWSELQASEHSGVYVDYYSALGGTIWLLNSGAFAIQNFVEFCNFVEGTVLFPRLYVSPNPCPTPGHSLRNVDEFTKTLATSGALAFVEMPHMPSADDENLNDVEETFRNRFGKMREVLRSQRRVEIVETILGVAAHAIHGMTLYPSVHNRFAYLESLGVRKSIRATLSLQSAYAALSRAAQEAVRWFDEYRGVEEIYIPPIPAIIMGKASSLDDIPYAVLDLRERFAPVRKAFADFDQTIADPSTPLKKSLRAMTLLKTVIEEISRPFDDQGKRVVAQWSDVGELIPFDGDFDADDGKSVTKLLLGKPLEVVLARLKRRRFLPLYSLRNDYLKRDDTHALIKKLWDCDLTDADVGLAKTYVMSPADVEKGNVGGPDVSPPNVLGFDIWSNKQGNNGEESQQEDARDEE
jgi:hypothetical protein